MTEYRQAIRLDPKYPFPHANLGLILREIGDLDGSIRELREALRINPKYTFATNNLRTTERWQQLLPRLADVAAGRAQPDTPAETCEFAQLLGQRFQKRYFRSVQMYAQAFAADAKMADIFTPSHRYNAACYAVRAAAGDDTEMTAFGIEEWGYLIDLARNWLQADLRHWTEQAKDPRNHVVVRQKLTQWKMDADLVAVRDTAFLAAIPPLDRAAWEQLWVEVDTVLAAISK